MTNPYQPPSNDALGPPTGAGSAVVETTSEKEVQDRAAKALLFGLGGLVCFGPLGIAAIQRGRGTRRLIDSTGVGKKYRGNAVAAVVLGGTPSWFGCWHSPRSSASAPLDEAEQRQPLEPGELGSQCA